MPTPTFSSKTYTNTSNGSATGSAANWATTRPVGQFLLAVVSGFRNNTGNTSITMPSGWTFIGREDRSQSALGGTAPLNPTHLTTAFWYRIASGTSGDNIAAGALSTGSDFYSGFRNGVWCWLAAYADVVGSLSGAFTISGRDAVAPALSGTSGADFSPTLAAVSRGTSLNVIATVNTTATPSGWSNNLSLAVTGFGNVGRMDSKAQPSAGIPSAVTYNSISSFTTLHFAVSGIPDGAAEWGVDRIAW